MKVLQQLAAEIQLQLTGKAIDSFQNGVGLSL